MASPFDLEDQPAQSELLFGRDQRAVLRARAIKLARESAREIIKKHLPGLFEQPPNIDGYEAAIPAILAAMKRQFPQLQRYRTARNLLSQGIENGNASGLWRLNLPPILVRVSRDPPLRTELWFRTSSSLTEWLARFDMALSNLDEDPFREQPELILGAVLLSAITHGGLCDPENLLALALVLGDERPLACTNEVVWVDFSHRAPRHLRNDTKNGVAITVRRWFADPISIGWLLRWMSLKQECRAAIVTGINGDRVLRLIRNAITTVSGDVPRIGTLPKSLSGLARHAVHIAEATTEIDLPEALLEVAIGRTSSASVPAWNWAMLVDAGRRYLEPELDPEARDPVAGKRSGKPSRRLGISDVVADLARALRRALSDPPGPDRKLTGAVLRVRLEENASRLMPGSPEKALVNWYLHLLDEGLVPSSVLRYHNAIGLSWLADSEGLELGDLEAGDLDNLYSNALQRVRASQRQFNAGRWQQFHDFLVLQFDAPPLLSPLFGAEDPQRMVRAAVIPIGLLNAVRKAIQNDTKTLDRLSRTSLELIVILGYRSGLRLGEILKLQLDDIESSEERWVFVRSNRYDDNKSDAARRKIPLAAMLTDKELELFNSYMNIRNSDHPGNASLLFSVPGNTHLPLAAGWVSRIIRHLLRSASNSDAFVFHHLRHSALSLTQLVLEGADHWAELFGGIKKDHAERIRVAITGHERPRRDRYWALARLAGHSSPAITFGSYLHFSDLIIGARFTESSPALPANAWRIVTGFSANRLGRIASTEDHASTKAKASSIPASLMVPPMVRALGPAVLKLAAATAENVPEELAPPKELMDRYHQAILALRKLERGEPLASIAFELGIREQDVKKWQDNARAIAKMPTRSGNSRHFDKGRSVRHRTELLLPHLPRTKEEKEEAENLIGDLRRVYKSISDDLRWAIGYVLTNSDMSDSGIRFRDVASLARFLTLFDGRFERKRWSATYHLELSNAEPEDRQWLATLDEIALSAERDHRHQGRAQLITLRLRHPNENKILQNHPSVPKGYSATTLRYICHVLGILIGLPARTED